MLKVLAIVNEKGGTAKTTTAVNLSAALGEMGKKVLLVDLDGQAASSRWLGVEDDTSFADALWRGDELKPIRDVIPGVSLAPGSGKLDSVAHDLRPTQGGQLRKLLSKITGFDYVVIDCPPSLGNRLLGNALLAATHAIVPVETSILAMDGLKILLTTINDVREGFDHDIALAGVLACRYDARTRLSRLVLAELRRALPGKVFDSYIRENVRLRECPASGQSILTYAPDSNGAKDYRRLARELMGVLAQSDASASEEYLQQGPTDEHRDGLSKLRQQVDALLRRSTPASQRETKAPLPEAQDASAPVVEVPATLEPSGATVEDAGPVEENSPEAVESKGEPVSSPAADLMQIPWERRKAVKGPAGQAPTESKQPWDGPPVSAPLPEVSSAFAPGDTKEEPVAVGAPSAGEMAVSFDSSPSPADQPPTSHADVPPESDADAGGPDYPALRAIVEGMKAGSKSGDENDHEHSSKNSGWLGILKKRPA